MHLELYSLLLFAFCRSGCAWPSQGSSFLINSHTRTHAGTNTPFAPLFSTETSNADIDAVDAVVVGAGPSGLASAISLARLGWQKIKVIERRTEGSLETNQAYSYRIDGRGRKFTGSFGLEGKLAALGVPGSTLQIVVAKTDGTLTQSSMGSLATQIVGSNRTVEAYWLPRDTFVDLLVEEIRDNWSNQIEILFDTKCDSIVRYPLPPLPGGGNDISSPYQVEMGLTNVKSMESKALRPSLLIGADGINSIVRKQLAAWATEDESGGKNGAKPAVNNIRPVKGKRAFEMVEYPSVSTGLNYKIISLPPSLPLLRSPPPPTPPPKGQKAEAQQPPAPTTPPATSEIPTAINHFSYAVRGLGTKSRSVEQGLSLGLLPIPDPARPRTATVIAYPEHSVWDIGQGKEGKEAGRNNRQELVSEAFSFFNQSFPQFPFDQVCRMGGLAIGQDGQPQVKQQTGSAPESESDTAVCMEEELYRFATSKSGAFPAPQHSNGIAYLMPPATATTDTCTNTNTNGDTSSSTSSTSGASSSSRGIGRGTVGVCLVGDAIHAFPPDLGQGVNAALEDVVALEQAIKKHAKTKTKTNADADSNSPPMDHRQLASALQDYSAARMPDCVALARMCQIGAPYQYPVTPSLGRQLWTINFITRIVLYKLSNNIANTLLFLDKDRAWRNGTGGGGEGGGGGFYRAREGVARWCTGLFNLPVFLGMADHNAPYSTVHARGRRTTLFLQSALLLAVLAVVKLAAGVSKMVL